MKPRAKGRNKANLCRELVWYGVLALKWVENHSQDSLQDGYSGTVEVGRYPHNSFNLHDERSPEVDGTLDDIPTIYQSYELDATIQVLFSGDFVESLHLGSRHH